MDEVVVAAEGGITRVAADTEGPEPARKCLYIYITSQTLKIKPSTYTPLTLKLNYIYEPFTRSTSPTHGLM